MRFSNGSFIERTKLRLVTKISPVTTTGIALLDKIELDLGKAKISQTIIPPMPYPQVYDDYSPSRPHIDHFDTALDEQRIEDLILWLHEQLEHPDIVSIPLLSNLPRRAGKSYKRIEPVKVEQTTLFTSDEWETTCIHGLKKRWCAICREQKKKRIEQTQEKKESHIDPFDLILPILQPPLGEDFDNPLAFPAGMELYPFQRFGVKFLLQNRRALLADEMGLGKSIQAIIALRCLFRMGDVMNGIILCPKSVLTDWDRKLWYWAPDIMVVKVAGDKQHRTISWETPAHIYLTTYDSYRQDVIGSLGGNGREEDIAKKKFDFVVLDEIQKIKNPTTSITKAVRIIDSPIRWGLSGTPLENRIEELISIFAYLEPKLLIYDDAKKPWKVKDKIEPYLLRRKSDAIKDFPKVSHNEKWLELTETQRETYDKAEMEGIVRLNESGDSVTVQHVLALITKLKEICNVDPVTGESCKLEWLLEKLEEVCTKEDKAIVFSQYPEKTLKVIEPQMRIYNPLIYSGSLSDSKRDSIVDTFQQQEDSKVLLMSVKSGGLGLTLTRANHVFHFDLWWNPAVSAQAEARAIRIGQKKTVFVTSLCTVETIEERIEILLQKKRELFKNVIDDLSDVKLSSVLTEDELFSLFDLKKDKPQAGLVKFTLKSLSQLTPHQFEKLIADLYERIGYHVRLTPRSRDQGVDVYAKRISDTGTENLAIQCKHYPAGKVGVEFARSLYGVIQAQPEITKGVLVTSGEFSKECSDFTRGKRIELFDGKYLLGLLVKYDLSTDVDKLPKNLSKNARRKAIRYNKWPTL